MHQDTGQLAAMADILNKPKTEQEKWKEISTEQATFLKHRLNKQERHTLLQMLQNNGMLCLQDMREQVARMRGFKEK